jgi:hypothetical protein
MSRTSLLGDIIMSTSITLTDADFEHTVLQSDLPVVVDFGAHGAHRAAPLPPSWKNWLASTQAV